MDSPPNMPLEPISSPLLAMYMSRGRKAGEEFNQPQPLYKVCELAEVAGSDLSKGEGQLSLS